MLTLRIWIINQYAVPPDRAGGARHYKLAVQLQQRCHEVLIVAGSFDHRTRTEFRLQPGQQWLEQDIQGVPYLWLRTPPYAGNDAKRFWNMLAFAARVWRGKGLYARPRPDVILGSTPTLFAAEAAAHLARRFRVPFVLEVRDLWPDSLIDIGNFSPRHPVIRALRLLERRLYRSADHIISLLPGAVSYIEAVRGREGSVTWIPNGVDTGRIPPPPTGNGLGDRFTVTYAGAHGVANGLETVLDAAQLLAREGESRILFRLIGDGPEKARLVRRASDQGLTNVEFMEPVPKAEIFRWLWASDACLMPLKPSPVFRWGVSPNKLFDYMAASRPVIFAVDTLHDPVSRSGGGVTIPPGDPVALANAVRRLAALSPAERQLMGERGRTYVAEYHDFAVLGGRLEKVLASLVA